MNGLYVLNLFCQRRRVLVLPGRGAESAKWFVSISALKFKQMHRLKQFFLQAITVLSVSILGFSSGRMSTTEIALTVQAVMQEMSQSNNGFIQQATEGLHDKFENIHSTLQIEDELLAGHCGKC